LESRFCFSSGGGFEVLRQISADVRRI
jgi:hypothetical protein